MKLLKSKLLLSAAAGLVLFWGSSCQNQTTSQSCETFSELPDPTADTLSDWSGVNEGLNVSFVSIDKRFPKSVNPELTAQEQESLIGWKGETVSAQVLLWTTEPLESVAVTFGEFTGDEGAFEAGQARFVRYVMTDEFAEGCGYRKPEDFKVSLSADMLDDLACMDLEANKVRPVWVTVDIPRDAKAGSYTSVLKINGNGLKEQELRLQLEVVDQELPKPSEWSFHLDQWQHPSAVARVDSLEVWSDAHFDALKPVMQLLADAGQKVITATLNKDPWNVQTFDPYEDMIVWYKNEDGSWEYDYAVFDRWVSFMMDLGVKKMINAYSIVPWNNELHYVDRSTNETVTVEADPGTPVFEEMWAPFLTDFSKHLDEKGWLSITNIAMDERDKASMDAAFELINRVAPELGVAFADNQKTYQRYPESRDVSVSANDPFAPEDLADRRARGVNSTFYIYCGNGFPNQFTFSDPAESTYLGWYALAANFDGFLRWAFNSWVENPMLDSRFRTWPAGDTYTVYPGGRSSIRHERTREGIQDYEKAQIVLAKLQEKGDEASIEQFNQAIEKLSTPKRVDGWNAHLNAAKKMLNELSRGL